MIKVVHSAPKPFKSPVIDILSLMPYDLESRLSASEDVDVKAVHADLLNMGFETLDLSFCKLISDFLLEKEVISEQEYRIISTKM